jgi:hypothetical protein
MISTFKSWMRIALTGALLAAVSAGPAWAAAPAAKEVPSRVTRIDFEECEPFQVRARVMEVRPERETFVVAEREICEMDLITGSGRQQTTYYDISGKPEEKHPYRVGQYLFVKGYLLPTGNVAALEVRAIEKPQEKRRPYKPIENQNKASRSASRRSAGGDGGQQP